MLQLQAGALVFYLLWLAVDGFNVDTQYKLTFSGPKNSYFGFSTSFHNNLQGSWLLVGAPKANQTLLGASGFVFEPGTLFKCKVEGRQVCEQVQLDSGGNTQGTLISRSAVDTYYVDLKDRMWLGVSLDVRDDGLVATCGHRWKNIYLYMKKKTEVNITNIDPQKITDYRVPGICYIITRELNGKGRRQIPQLSWNEGSRGGIPIDAYAMTGISAHFVKEDGELLLGAPGTYNWDGFMITLGKPNEQPAKVEARKWGPRLADEKGVQLMYFGYAVTSGRFSPDDRSIYYVVGAPRYQYIGKVYILRMPKQGVKSDIKQEFKGNQLGEYFGSAVCATDVNNDGLDDVFIGAPMFASSGSVDEGKVYVYINDKYGTLKKSFELRGSKIRNSRFGTSIAAAGDINQDGYNDIAIGAPFENGRGAVYLYFGNQEQGLDENYKQKITAEKVGMNVQGFGISISKGYDIDRNRYPDIAVGSFSSDNAFILKSQPVIKFSMWLKTSPDKVNIDAPQCQHENNSTRCFNVTACMKYINTLEHIRNRISVDMKLEVDALYRGKSPRALLVSDVRGVVNLTNIITNKVQLRPQEDCYTYHVFIRNDVKNYLSPIMLRLSIDLTPQSSLDKFCSSCPVLDPRSLKSVTRQVYFLTGCGSDACHADLQLNASVIYQNIFVPSPSLLVGLNESVSLHVFVTNKEEPAFVSELKITIPNWATFSKPPFECGDRGASEERNGLTLVCDLGNPLPKQVTYERKFHINLEELPVDVRDMTIILHATTGSSENEELLADNIISLNIPVRKVADITVVGFSTHDLFSLLNLNITEDSALRFAHQYTVKNLGPTTLDRVQLLLKIPKTEDARMMLNFSVSVRAGKFARIHKCKGGNVDRFSEAGEPTDVLVISESLERKRRSTAGSSEKINRVFQELECGVTDSNCLEITCEIVDMVAKDAVKFTMSMVLAVDSIDTFKDHEAINLRTSAIAVIEDPKENIQPTDDQPDFDSVVTRLDSGMPAPEELKDWIIPVGIFCGLLLLLLLLVLFYKLGFFKRQQRDKMNKLKIKNETNDNQPPLVGDDRSMSVNPLVDSDYELDADDLETRPP